MSRRRGCRGCGCFLSVILILALLVGGVYVVYTNTSPSTFGLTNLGGFELGELAEYNFSEIVGTFNELATQPKKGTVVKVNYDDTVKAEAQKSWGIDENGEILTTGAAYKINRFTERESNKITSLSDFIIKKTSTTSYQTIDLNGVDFVYLLNNILSDVETLSGEYQSLRDFFMVFRTSINDIPITVEEVTFSNTGGSAAIHTVFEVNITKFKNALDDQLSLLPSFIRPSLGEKIYMTTDNKLTIDSSGKLAVDKASGEIKINSMNAKKSGIVLNVVFSQMSQANLSVETASAVVSDTVVQIINNIGGVGRLSGGKPAYGISGGIRTVAESGGAITIITHSTGSSSGGNTGGNTPDPDPDPDTPDVPDPDPDNPGGNTGGGDDSGNTGGSGGDDNENTGSGGDNSGEGGSGTGEENPDDTEA